MTKTATRPAPADELPMEPLPDELQISPPAAPVVDQTYTMLPIGAIFAGPHNPRRDLGDLDGLVASIRAVGILEPLVVEWASPSSPYTLLAGHRRHAAADLAGLTEVPCLVRQTAATPALRMEIALIENLQREGLAPLDEADGYLELTKLGLSQRAIADRVGCSQSHVSKRMALLELPAPVQTQVSKGTLTLDAAAALVKLKDHPEKLAEAAKERPERIIDAVVQAEKEIAWEAARADLLVIAEGRSWPVVDAPKDSYSKRPFKLLARWGYSEAELDLDVHKHEGEPCHAVMIPKVRVWPHHEEPSATSVCTDPARHDASGASTLKAKVEPKAERQLPAVSREMAKQAKERQQAIEHRDAAAAARRAVLAKAVSEHKRPCRPTPPLTATLRTVVRWAHEFDLTDDVCALLGIQVEPEAGYHDWINALDAYVARGDQELHRAAFAVAIVDVESGLNHSFDDTRVPEHYAYLATLGYEPSPWERAKLAEVAKQDGADDGE